MDAQPTTLAKVRRLFGLWMDLHDVDPTAQIDAQLVMGELLSNAIEHGEDPCVTVDVERERERMLKLCVSNETHVGLSPRSDWVITDPLSVRGRGLPMVAQVSESIDVDWDGRTLEVAAHVYVGEFGEDPS